MKKCEDCEGEAINDFHKSFDNILPYEDYKINKNETIRIFKKEFADYLLKWHTDEDSRLIKSLNRTDWQFQFDNELPFIIKEGDSININKGRIHRLIKGTNSLILLIIK